ncbi:MAG: holin [Coriobacteriales bacterium]|jgi:hypothetical protein|nr:holin [Coriobacteriales bacterium]
MSNTKKGLACLADKNWWNAAGTRAVRTAAQSAVAVVGVSTLIQDYSWAIIGGTVAAATVLSLLNSLAGLPEVPNETGTKEGTD